MFGQNHHNIMDQNLLKQISELKNNNTKLLAQIASTNKYNYTLAEYCKVRSDTAEIQIKNCEFETKFCELKLNFRIMNASIIYFCSNYIGGKINIYAAQKFQRQPYSGDAISFASFMSAILYIGRDQVKLIRLMQKTKL